MRDAGYHRPGAFCERRSADNQQFLCYPRRRHGAQSGNDSAPAEELPPHQRAAELQGERVAYERLGAPRAALGQDAAIVASQETMTRRSARSPRSGRQPRRRPRRGLAIVAKLSVRRCEAAGADDGNCATSERLSEVRSATAPDEKQQQSRLLTSLPLRRELRADHLGDQYDGFPIHYLFCPIPCGIGAPEAH
jgi:hypothetical protein